MHVTSKRLARQANLVRHVIADSLDPGLLRTLRGCALYSLDHAEWICGAGNLPEDRRAGRGRLFGVPVEEMNDRNLSRMRAQAIRAYPVLSWEIVKHEPLREMIDAGKPLARGISSFFCVPEAGVRNLNGVTWQMAGVSPREALDCITPLANVPREMAPKRRSEHQALQRIARFARDLRIPVEDMVRRFARGGSPYRFDAELKRISPQDVNDAAGYVVDKLLLPARLHRIRALCEADGACRQPGGYHSLRREMIGNFVASLPAKDMFDLSDRWHRNLERHEDRLATLGSRLSWQPFLGETEIAGVRVRELSSTASLKIQGRREGHCVGGYTERVIRGSFGKSTLIFSLEKGEEIIGTVEISLRPVLTAKGVLISAPGDREWEASILQNRSRRNGPVCPEADAAARRLCKTIEQAAEARMGGYLSSLSLCRNKDDALKGMSAHLRGAAYDIWAPGALEAAWDELSVYLPRSVRKSGLSGLLDPDLVEAQPTAPEQVDMHPSRSWGRIPGKDIAAAGPRKDAPDGPPFWERDIQTIRALSDRQAGGRMVAPDACDNPGYLIREDIECLEDLEDHMPF